MKSKQLLSYSWGKAVFLLLLSLCITVLGGVFATWGWSSNLSSVIIALGLDPQRAQLLTALFLTAGAAGLGALVGRRKGIALAGAGLVFLWSYLLGFYQTILQPVRDPLGNLEPLNVGALVHTLLVLFALALLFAFVGAAVGCALSEVLFDPFLPVARFVRERLSKGRRASTEMRASEKASAVQDEGGRKRKGLSWVALMLFVLLCVLASGSGDLLLYSPDSGLHTAPVLQTRSAEPRSGTLVADSVVSPALGGQRKPFLVYLPPSYNTPQGRLRRYPTLYLLHGSPGSDSDWVTGGKVVQAANTLIAEGKMAEVILILPDGNGRPGQTSEWGNSADGHQNMETYVAVDLVKYVDQKYRTLATSADRGIGGLSMGGFGAMNIAIHHPNTFGFVISLGGYYRAEGSIWGKNQAYLRKNSPIDVLPTDPQAWHLHMYLGAATKDQPYYADTLQFVQELKRLHLPYQLDIEPGYHAWNVWQVQIYHAFLWLRWGS